MTKHKILNTIKVCSIIENNDFQYNLLAGKSNIIHFKHYILTTHTRFFAVNSHHIKLLRVACLIFSRSFLHILCPLNVMRE